MTSKSLEMRARRAAKRVGLRAIKSRWRANSLDNFGGFLLTDPHYNCVVWGSRFELDAEDVIACCEEMRSKLETSSAG